MYYNYPPFLLEIDHFEVPRSLFVKASLQCKIVVVVISCNFNVNED